jgi:protein SCO1/2
MTRPNNIFLWLIVLIGGCRSNQTADILPFFNRPDFTPEWIDPKSAAYDSIHRIPPFRFLDQDSNWVTEQTVDGKIYVADFFFTTCKGICPRLTKNLGELQRRFNTNPHVLFVSHSVLPDEDSVAVLRRYAKRNNIPSGRWYLLTGNRDSIYRLARREYFAGDSVGYFQVGNEFLHTENFILLDRHRRIRGVYNGTLPVEIDRLEEDIYTLLREE